VTLLLCLSVAKVGTLRGVFQYFINSRIAVLCPRILDKSILEVVHEGVKDLCDAGLLNEVTMREFDAQRLPPIKIYSAAQIKRIRLKSKTSQGVFAASLNTSKSTVQKWEQGANKPNGPSLKLLNQVEVKGIGVLG